MLRNLRIIVCTREIVFTPSQRYSSAAVAAANEVTEHENAKTFSEIPGPKSYPFIGSILSFIPGIGELGNITQNDMTFYLHDKYGDIVKLNIPGRNPMVFCYNPQDFEKVFLTPSTRMRAYFQKYPGHTRTHTHFNMPNRPGAEGIKYYREVLRKEMSKGLSGLVASQGETWQIFRTKVNQPMLQPKTTRLYIQPTDEVTQDFVHRVRLLRDSKQEMPDDFLNELQKWALESVTVIALDTRLGCLGENLKPDSEPQQMINAVQDMFDTFEAIELKGIPFWKYFSTPTWRKFVKSIDFINNITIKYIMQAVVKMENDASTNKEPSLLQRLLDRDPEKSTAILMAQDMMFAGIDMTSYAAANTLYHLAKNPEKQEKLHEEICCVIGSNKQITTQNLNDMKYLKASIKESMRLTPIGGGNFRRIPKDIVLSNYIIPKNTDVITGNSVVCRKDEIFPQANKFIPERWLKDSPKDIKNNINPFVYLPFGFGPRMCIGRRIAELELEVLLTRMVQNFHIEYHYEDMKFKAAPLLRPALPLKLKMIDRK